MVPLGAVIERSCVVVWSEAAFPSALLVQPPIATFGLTITRYLMLAWVFTVVAVTAWAEGPPSPAVGIIPTNASLVVGTVLTRTVWAPGTLLGSRPPLPPDRTWYAIQLRIESVTQAQPDLPSTAEPGVVEAF